MPLVQTPTPMGAYPSTTVDGVWVFPFALVFDKAIHDPQTLRFELQVDTSSSFGSPNCINVFSNAATITNFQNGPLGKAIELQLPGRQINSAVQWFWRMRINGYGYLGQYMSPWSQTNQLVVPINQSLSQAALLFADVSDQYAYSKVANSSNLYKVLAMIGRELDMLLTESGYSRSDLLIAQARDTALANNFGTLTKLAPVATEPAASYRWKVLQLFKAFLDVPGVIQGILQTVTAFVGEPPNILDVTNTIGWILGINYIKAPTRPDLQPTIKLYSTFNKGFNWTLQVFNSWSLPFDKNVLENYVNLIKPAHTLTIFSYPPIKHAQVRLNTIADWQACTLSNIVLNSAGYPTLPPGQTSGTITTLVLRMPWTLSGWDVLNLSALIPSSNQTVVYRIQSSPDGNSFSGYETVGNGASPVSTPLNPFIQMQITLTTTNTSVNPILTEVDQNLIHS